jgi:hypothetical protein
MAAFCFEKGSVQIPAMGQPVGRGELHPLSSKSLSKIQKLLVLN